MWRTLTCSPLDLPSADCGVMSSMLEGLDLVAWANLRHAYGSAADVPGRIRALRSADPRARAAASDRLFGNIFHQGGRFEATTQHAVPFLLEVLAAPDTPDRAGILRLLVALAIGYDHDLLPGGWPLGQPDEAHRAVRAGVPLFRDLVRDGDSAVRIEAVYALAWYPQDAAESLPSPVSLLGHDDELLVATATVAVGLLGGRPEVGFADGRPVVRRAAAVAAAAVDGQEAGDAVVDESLAAAAGSVNDVRGVPFLAGTSTSTRTSRCARSVRDRSTPGSTGCCPESPPCRAATR